MIIEQDDQAVAGMDEGDVVVADRRKVELGRAVEMDRDRLIGLRLGKFYDLGRFGVGQGTSGLGNRDASVHDFDLSTWFGERKVGFNFYEKAKMPSNWQLKVFLTFTNRQWSCTRFRRILRV